MKVTIIIPNYNGAHFLKPCLEKLKVQTFQDFEVLVVDNGSGDGSLALLKKLYPEVRVIPLGKNQGFSRAVNVGIRASRSPYVILLNNDTEPEPGYVEALVKSIGRSKRIFSVSPKMVQLHNKALVDDAGDLYTLVGWAAQRGVGQPVEDYNRPCRVFSACAGAAIYRRSVFEKIGCFDELHFAYLEDLDVGFRAKLYGYRNEYCPEAVVYHVGSGTSGSRYNPFKVRLAARNSVYLNYKNMPSVMLALNAPAIAAGHVLKYLFFKRLGFEKEYMSGLKEGLRTANRCKKVPFRRDRLPAYVLIEGELLKNSGIYAWEFIKRRLRKRQGTEYGR